MKFWWLDLGYHGQSMVKKVLGNFPSLMQVTLCRELSEATTTFWDETRSVFRFGDIDMTQLLKKIRGYMVNKSVPLEIRWQKDEAIISKSVTLVDVYNKLGLQGSKMVSFVMKSKIFGGYLVDGFGNKQERSKYEAESADPKSWESKRVFAFIIYFLGMVIFPNRAKEEVHTHLITVADALCNGIDKGPCKIGPMIVADIYRALGCC